MNQIPCPRKLVKKKTKWDVERVGLEKDKPVSPFYYWLKLKIMI